MTRNGYKGTPPTLQDFYRLLQMQPEPEAQGLALSSELFITGTLNTFARHTNVDTQARIIAYDIRELGEQLMPLGMLVTLDAIYNRVIQNWKKGRRSGCGEIHKRPPIGHIAAAQGINRQSSIVRVDTSSTSAAKTTAAPETMPSAAAHARRWAASASTVVSAARAQTRIMALSPPLAVVLSVHR